MRTSIETGSGVTTVTGLAAAASINAAELADGVLLTLEDATNYTVTALSGDLDASMSTGTLAVDTADVATTSIETGSGVTTVTGLAAAASINAAELADGVLLCIVTGKQIGRAHV